MAISLIRQHLLIVVKLFKMRGKVIKFCEGAILPENLKTSAVREFLNNMITFEQQYKSDGRYLMQGLVNLLLNALYGIQIRKDNIEFYKCKFEHWMQTENKDNALDYWKLSNGNSSAKMEKDDRLDGDSDIKKTLPSHLGALILKNIKWFMNNSFREMNSSYKNIILYGDTNSMYIERKFSDVLEKACLMGYILWEGKNDHKPGGVFYGLFLAPKK